MNGKSPIKSKTLWVGVTAFIGGLVTLIMHYSGMQELSPEIMGAAWTDLFTSVAMIALRLVTKEPLVVNDGGDDDPKEASLTSILLIMAVAAAFFCPGCSTLTVHAKDTIGVDVSEGPPCTVSVSADGEVVATVVGPKACKVKDDR